MADTTIDERRGRRPRRRSGPTSPRCTGARPSRSTPARPDAVARRRERGQRTARENVDDLCDPGSFVEYGSLVVAAQRAPARRCEDLIERTPADGLVAGLGRVNGDLFDDDHARVAVMSYDYTVLAGTQGVQNHRKKDRLFELAERLRLPVVFFTEGGGGRPGDTDARGDVRPRHHGLRPVRPASAASCPLVGITSGRCFAGNAALLGCCDVIIATERLEHRHGRPGHDRGRRPRRVHARGGRPDGRAGAQRRRRHRWSTDEAEAVRGGQAVPRRTSRARVADWSCADQRLLRHARPREPAAGLRRPRRHRRRSPTPTRCSSCGRASAPAWSPRWSASRAARSASSPTTRPTSAAPSTPTAPTRRPASCSCATPSTCPILFLCDTPGFMVGPEAEKTALGPPRQPHVRHRRQPHRAVLHDRAAQGLRPRRPGHGRRQLPRTALHRGLADRRVRRHGPRGRGAARASATSSRPIADPAEREALFDDDGRPALRARQGASTPPPTSRSTTSSTRPTRGRWITVGAATRRRRPRPAPARSARCIDTW